MQIRIKNIKFYYHETHSLRWKCSFFINRKSSFVVIFIKNHNSFTPSLMKKKYVLLSASVYILKLKLESYMFDYI